MMKTVKTTKQGLEISPVFTRQQAHCRECGAIFYVDTKTKSTGEEIFELEDIYYDSHPSENSVIELV